MSYDRFSELVACEGDFSARPLGKHDSTRQRFVAASVDVFAGRFESYDNPVDRAIAFVAGVLVPRALSCEA
jgi:hypothetical protein